MSDRLLFLLHTSGYLRARIGCTPRRVGFAKRDPQCKETDDVLILLKQIPVQPGGLVILLAGIVVPALGIHELVASTGHRRAVGKKQETAEVLDQLFLQDYHLVRHPIVAFPSAIPAVRPRTARTYSSWWFEYTEQL